MALPILQSAPLITWFSLVNKTVPEPYLDEVFHVRQAQHYCQNHFNVWDPKITTPPGLYLLSYIISPIAGCNITSLRLLNVFCLTTVQVIVASTYAIRRSRDDWNAQHSAINVALFPPLFFFGALYYTDVPSSLSVVIYYALYLQLSRRRSSSWLRIPLLSIVGIASLMFRQTNIFWVAVFPGALLLVNDLDRGHHAIRDSMEKGSDGFGESMVSVARASWKFQALYNPPIKDAAIEDYIKTIMSIIACTAKLLTQPSRLFDLLWILAPAIVTTLAFLSFIIWNGSVVLGDKSNHIATIHVPQLLYMWPYMTFFSWPIVYPYLATIPFGLLARIPNLATLEGMLMFKRRSLVPRISLLVALTGLACVAVYFNTIVHPFTLADNRHYTFYVFRLLMRPGWVKYAVTPIYILCGWSCIQALGARPMDLAGQQQQSPTQSEPNVESSRQLSLPDGSKGATTSFAIIWLATSAMQLVTAPLVEPRYLILPWVFWRIHVPLQKYSPAQRMSEKDESFMAKPRTTDHRLLLETLWLLAVNAVTGYIFLYRGFEWAQEPGKVQRFMW